MREILFRAKAINRKEGFEYRTNYKNGDWVYGLITKKFDDEFPILPAEMTNEDGVSGIDVDYKTIGQYTGLTDKNGKKIFEGDIVRYVIVDIDGSEDAYIGAICFEPEKAGFAIKRDDYRAFFVNSWLIDIEVIGNIYDNPELMNG